MRGQRMLHEGHRRIDDLQRALHEHEQRREQRAEDGCSSRVRRRSAARTMSRAHEHVLRFDSMPFAARAMILVLLVAGCGDEVVGYFDASSGSGDDPSGSTSLLAETSSSSTTGDGGFIVPGCFRDEFDNDVIDPLWNTWIEEDATLVESGGALRLTPPRFGVWDTGIVGAYNYGFPFSNGHVRMRVSEPPDPARSVVLFLTVGEVDDTLISMQLASGEIVVNATVATVEQYREAFPKVTYPAWIGIRAGGTQVHFEVSDDGSNFTVLSTHDQPTPLEDARVLVMAQTYGEDTDRSAVVVDELETCVE